MEQWQVSEKLLWKVIALLSVMRQSIHSLSCPCLLSTRVAENITSTHVSWKLCFLLAVIIVFIFFSVILFFPLFPVTLTPEAHGNKIPPNTPSSLSCLLFAFLTAWKLIKRCWFQSASFSKFLKYLNKFCTLFSDFPFLSICNKINYVRCTAAYPHEGKSETRDFSLKKAILSCFRCSKGINLPYRIALEDCDNWKHPYSLHVQRDLSDFVM